TLALDLARDLDLYNNRDLALARARALVLDRDRASALALDLALALVLARDLALDRTRDLVLARDLALDRARDLARDLAYAHDLARALALAHDLALVHNLVHELVNSLDSDSPLPGIVMLIDDLISITGAETILEWQRAERRYAARLLKYAYIGYASERHASWWQRWRRFYRDDGLSDYLDKQCWMHIGGYKL
ncbi:MAG: hypothetical protein M3458_16715, partial [Acidobacteriota bacterium]|nr:hypothetical protein [Acidobacteriota bacterium]